MKAEHTPGPWKWSAYHGAVLQAEVSRDGCCLAVADLAETPHKESNARLIAAAPELMEALAVLTKDEKIRAWLAINDPRALGQARAAIAKAEGGAR